MHGADFYALFLIQNISFSKEPQKRQNILPKCRILCWKLILNYSESKYPVIPTGCLTNIKRTVHGVRRREIERQLALTTPKVPHTCTNIDWARCGARQPQCVNKRLKFQRNHAKYLHPDTENANKTPFWRLKWPQNARKYAGSAAT